MQINEEAVRDLDLSVVIITLDEESHIAQCLRSLPLGAEVIVLDSGSTDGTRKLCEAAGAHFLERPFTNYADQKNFAISAATRKYVLSIDADERVTPELAADIERVVRSDSPSSDAFRVKRQLHFMGHAMRYGRTVDYPVRLFKRGRGEFKSSIHERFQVKAGDATGTLNGVLQHFSYDDLTDYFQTFNRFTTLVAQNHLKNGRKVSLLRHVFRPWFEFLSRYFFRLGFLDGYPGYTYALMSSFYTYVKYAKLRELAQRQQK